MYACAIGTKPMSPTAWQADIYLRHMAHCKQHKNKQLLQCKPLQSAGMLQLMVPLLPHPPNYLKLPK
jgi:hypothetical protein